MRMLVTIVLATALVATGGSAFAKKSRHAMPAARKGSAATTSGSGGAVGRTGATQTGAGGEAGSGGAAGGMGR